MIKTLIPLMTVFTLLSCSNRNSYETRVTIDHIEDGIVSVETVYKDDIQTFDVPTEDFNITVKEQDRLNFTEVKGKFYHGIELSNVDGEISEYYQFRSDDDSVWWLLTEEEVGEIPNFTDAYTLIFYDNGTTAENKPCDCISEWECECELYDDIFLGIYKD